MIDWMFAFSMGVLIGIALSGVYRLIREYERDCAKIYYDSLRTRIDRLEERIDEQDGYLFPGVNDDDF